MKFIGKTILRITDCSCVALRDFFDLSCDHDATRKGCCWWNGHGVAGLNVIGGLGIGSGFVLSHSQNAKISVPNGSLFAGAVLPASEVLDDMIVALPGLLGAWDAADYSGSGPWLPRIGGAARIEPAVAGLRPILSERDGRAVLRFENGSKCRINSMTGASLPAMSSLTYASRSYYWDAVTNFQKIFDLGAPEFFPFDTGCAGLAMGRCWNWRFYGDPAACLGLAQPFVSQAWIRRRDFVG